MTKPHTISRDELIAHSASATKHSSKVLEFNNRNHFKVRVNGVIVYEGQNLSHAVNTYNEAG